MAQQELVLLPVTGLSVVRALGTGRDLRGHLCDEKIPNSTSGLSDSLIGSQTNGLHHTITPLKQEVQDDALDIWVSMSTCTLSLTAPLAYPGQVTPGELKVVYISVLT